MAELTITLTGFAELAAGLRELPKNVGKNMLRSAVASGAAVVRVQAKANAEAMRVTGTLARSIYQAQIPEASNDEKQTFYVGCRQGKRYQKVGKRGVSKDAYYARFVELGHWSRPPGTKLGKDGKPRAMRLKQWGKARLEDIGERSRLKQIHWVGPKPFLRPAFDVTKDAQVDAMRAKLAARLASYKIKTK